MNHILSVACLTFISSVLDETIKIKKNKNVWFFEIKVINFIVYRREAARISYFGMAVDGSFTVYVFIFIYLDRHKCFLRLIYSKLFVL